MSLKELRDTLDYLKTELKEADGETKTKLETSYQATLDAVTRMTENLGKPSSSTAAYKSSQKLKGLEVAVMDVPMFI